MRDQSKTPRRAGIYVRISIDRTGDGAGVERQREDCAAKAKLLGWEMVDTYIDNDVSATRSKVRPRYRDMLADLDSGRIDAIVAWQLDRLTRKPSEQAELMTMVQEGRLALALHIGDVDFTSHTGRLVAGMLVQIAQYESEQISTRVRRRQQQLREQGMPFGGGKRPYGYDATRRVVVEDEAGVIRRIATDVLAGKSTGSIARALNDESVPTVTGAAWTRTTVKAVVTKPRLWGDLTYKGSSLGQARWPKILEPAVGERLLAVLASPERRSAEQDSKRKHLLSGIATCVCGSPMYMAMTGKPPYKQPSYKCTLQACTSINARHLDGYVMERVLRRVPVEVPSTSVAEEALRKEIGQLREARDRMVRLLEVGELSEGEFLASRARTAERLTDAEQEFARIVTVQQPLGPDALIENAADLTLIEKRRMVERYVEELTIRPTALRGKGFDPERVLLRLSGREIDMEWHDDAPDEPWGTVEARLVDGPSPG